MSARPSRPSRRIAALLRRGAVRACAHPFPALGFPALGGAEAAIAAGLARLRAARVSSAFVDGIEVLTARLSGPGLGGAPWTLTFRLRAARDDATTEVVAHDSWGGPIRRLAVRRWAAGAARLEALVAEIARGAPRAA